MRRFFNIGLLILCSGICNFVFASDIEQINKRLGMGINLGNALEAPKEGEWGLVLQEEYFKIIKDAGFDSIRIPVRWSAHADVSAPYQIDPKFMSRVEWAVKEGLKNNLAVVLTMHHYNELYADPDSHSQRFIEIWKQISDYFQDKSLLLYFEPLNEPQGRLDADKWNELIQQVLAVIRSTNPDRAVIFGPAGWNNLNSLAELQLPEDHHLIVTCHYYEPYHFTHQGAFWDPSKSMDKWLGTLWTGSKEEKEKIKADFNIIRQWANEHNRPVFIGEYGTYEKADFESRVRWTRYVSGLSSQYDFSRSYWDFCCFFGLYDTQMKQWKEPLLKAAMEK